VGPEDGLVIEVDAVTCGLLTEDGIRALVTGLGDEVPPPEVRVIDRPDTLCVLSTDGRRRFDSSCGARLRRLESELRCQALGLLEESLSPQTDTPEDPSEDA
jgi:hypothetical protein